MTQVTGIILILLSIGILIYWLATGRRSKPLLKFVCVFIAIMGFLLILKDKLVEVTLKDWLSIKTSAAEATADAKTIADIKQQVLNQRATIDLVATDAQTAKNLSEEASNKVALAEQKLKDLDDTIQKANGSLKKLDAATEFTLLVTKAESGDRAAFFKLGKIKITQPSEADAAESIIGAIVSKIQIETALKETSVHPEWNSFGIDPEKASLQQLKEYYFTKFANYPAPRFYIIRQIFNDNRFSELEHFDFLAIAMQQDEELGVLEETCKLMDTKRKSAQNFPNFDDYLNWYKDNRTNFKATP
jgi:hypothetical protein